MRLLTYSYNSVIFGLTDLLTCLIMKLTCGDEVSTQYGPSVRLMPLELNWAII